VRVPVRGTWHAPCALAAHYDVDIEETSWRDLGVTPHTRNKAHQS
jgi:hypothetical protein